METSKVAANPSSTPEQVQGVTSGDARLQADSKQKLPPTRRLIWLVVGLHLGILILLTLFWTVFRGTVSTNDAQVDVHIASISSKVPGFVRSIAVNDNSRVRGGDPLLTIDSNDYQADVGVAKAAFEQAEAQAQSSKLNIDLLRESTSNTTASAEFQGRSDAADLDSATIQLETAANATLLKSKADVEAKRAINDRAQRDLERYKQLLAKEDVSHLQYDSIASTASVAQDELVEAEQVLLASQHAVDLARANAESATARLSRSQALIKQTRAQEMQVPIAEAGYKAAIANAEHARAALDKAKLDLGYCTITSPIIGQVTQKSVQVGDYVTPGQLLLTVVPLDEVFVTANFKETQLSKIRPGQRARIHVDTYGQTFDGTVDSIAGASGSVQALLPPQNATGNFVKVVQRIPVKILVKLRQGDQAILRPGMNVEATVYTH